MGYTRSKHRNVVNMTGYCCCNRGKLPLLSTWATAKPNKLKVLTMYSHLINVQVAPYVQGVTGGVMALDSRSQNDTPAPFCSMADGEVVQWRVCKEVD